MTSCDVKRCRSASSYLNINELMVVVVAFTAVEIMKQARKGVLNPLLDSYSSSDFDLTKKRTMTFKHTSKDVAVVLINTN